MRDNQAGYVNICWIMDILVGQLNKIEKVKVQKNEKRWLVDFIDMMLSVFNIKSDRESGSIPSVQYLGGGSEIEKENLTL